MSRLGISTRIIIKAKTGNRLGMTFPLTSCTRRVYPNHGRALLGKELEGEADEGRGSLLWIRQQSIISFGEAGTDRYLALFMPFYAIISILFFSAHQYIADFAKALAGYCYMKNKVPSGDAELFNVLTSSIRPYLAPSLLSSMMSTSIPPKVI